MNPKDWQKVKEIFNETVDLPLHERKILLDEKLKGQTELRIEIEKMLDFAAEETHIDEPLENSAFELFANGNNSNLKQIGDYKIIKEIGQGGMGTVFEAIRESPDFTQRVALKVIKLGMDTDIILSRFQHERQILASLQHPNIAGFIDGGKTAEGLPFYAMEFIEGTEIDDYYKNENLSIEERLKIFLQVCDAVQYAHQNFIAHRDLKPNNILIKDDKTVKLLDFGIAKVVSNNETISDKKGTVTEFGMMTPAYASPEQVRGEKVGVQSDIYSLGVILFELLTEQKPFDFKGLRPDEAIKIICESDPIKPSSVITKPISKDDTRSDDISTGQNLDETVDDRESEPRTINLKLLKGDLDNIILKALQKTPERRYASVQEFSEDIRRHLLGLPVSARPDTFAYRTSKFISRNKVGVITTSLIFVALVAGLLATFYQYRIAQQERQRAEKRFEQVRKLANNVVFKYHDAIASLPGSTATREMLVTDATEYLDNLAQDAEDKPDLQHELARAYAKIGDVQGSIYTANLGDSEGALKSYEKSNEIYENLVGKFPNNSEYLKNYFDAVNQLALLLTRLNRWNDAKKYSQKLIDISKKLTELEPNNLDFQIKLVRSYQTMSDVVNFFEGLQPAILRHKQELKLLENLIEKDPNDETLRRNLTVALQRIGTKSEYYVEILKATNSSQDEIDKIYIEAAEMHLRSLKVARQLKKDFPEKTVYNRYISAININYGTALARIGKGSEGLPLIQNACDDLRKTAENDAKNNEAKRDVSECLQYLAFAYDAMNNSQKAIEANDRSIKILEEITVKDPTNFEFLSQAHLTFDNTGDIFFREQKYNEALDYYQRGLKYVEKMSKLNETSQIKLLQSDSNRKTGNAYLEVGEKNKSKEFLNRAKKDLEELKEKNELSKNDEHKFILIDQALEKAKN